MKRRIKIVRPPKLLHREYAVFRATILEYFVKHVLPHTKNILDPMAGTASLIPYIERSGVTAQFNDLLPIHLYINQAKTYETYATLRINERKNRDYIERQLVDCLSGLKRRRLVISEKWIHDDVVESLIAAWKRTEKHEEILGRFLRAGILLCVRSFSSITISAHNSTWCRPGGMSSEKGYREVIAESIQRFLSYYSAFYPDVSKSRKSRCTFSNLDASNLKLRKKVDTIFTSPAYANRYDYTRMYAPELYFLSKVDSNEDSSSTRTSILASNVVEDYETLEDDLLYISKVSPKTTTFLSEVKEKGRKKKRKKEKDYYLRFFAKYYANLFRILDNLATLFSSNGAMYIVVQDNVHRGTLNDMVGFTEDFLNNTGFETARVLEELVTHQGRRNISADDPLVLKKHKETIIEVRK